jgi:serine phosphatase RsbU (regulator of sigma subunit)/transcriptional regulator with GAF, ATPase, and Fis domain
MRESATAKTHARDVWLSVYSLGVGGGGLLTLVALSWATPLQPRFDWLLFFTLLSLIVKRSGFYIVPQIRHSLVGVADISAILIFGPVIGGWVAALSSGLYLLLHALRRGQRRRQSAIELPLFSGGLRAFMALASGAVYQLTGGEFPLSTLTLSSLIHLSAVFVTWFVLDHAGRIVWAWLQGGAEMLSRSRRSIWLTSFVLEFLPLPVTALVAPVFAWGWLPFLMFAVGLLVVSFIIQRLADVGQSLEARVGELSGLAETGRALVEAQLDIDQLCELIYRQAGRIVDTSNFHLGLFEGDSLVLKVWVVAGQRQPSQTFSLAAGEGIVGWMRQTKQSLLVRDFTQDMNSLPAKPRYISETPPRSAVFVPLVAGDQVIGSMTIQSFEPAAYTQNHVQLLSLMANQAAVVIANARLFQEERQRAKQLALVGQVSRQVAAITELDTLFHQVVHLIQETFGYYHVGIFTVDSGTEQIFFQAGTDPALPLRDFCCQIGEGIIGWVAQQGQPLLASDVSKEPRYRFAEFWPATQAELAMPLQVESQIVGILDVQSDRVNAFGKDDVFVLQALADQVAVAIRNASLYDLERQRRQMAEIQRELTQILSSTLELDALLNLVLALLAQAIDCDVALIFLRDGDTLVVRAAQGVLDADDLVGLAFEPGECPRLDRLRQAQHPILLSDEENSLPGSDPLEISLGMEVQSGLGVPLLVQDESLGGFLLVSQTSRQYTYEDVQAAIIFATQAALVIENARLYAAQQEEAWVSTALLQVAETVNSLNTLDEILATVVRITPILVGVERCAILLWDGVAEVFVPAQQYGLSPKHAVLFWQLRLSTQATFTAPSETQDNSMAADIVSLLGSQNLLVLPMQTRGDASGIMLVGYDDESHRSSERWMNILTGIANQLAVAVESDRLAHEAAEQERLARELQVAQEIQASFLPECCPVLPGWEIAAYWRSARRVGGDFYDFLQLPNGCFGFVIADVADKGIPAALFMALSRTLVRVSALPSRGATQARGPAQALERTNQLIFNDARSDLFVTIFYAVIDAVTGRMFYTNAGHNPPLLVRADGRVENLHCPGIALGVLEEIHLKEKETRFDPGDTLVLYTDGITEAINANEEEFGLNRLAEIAATRRRESAAEILAHVDATVTSFVAGQPTFDDMTLVIVQRSNQRE